MHHEELTPEQQAAASARVATILHNEPVIMPANAVMGAEMIGTAPAATEQPKKSRAPRGRCIHLDESLLSRAAELANRDVDDYIKRCLTPDVNRLLRQVVDNAESLQLA